MTETADTLRLDKWLWHARFFKSRGLAAALVKSGRCRVDGVPVSKPARTIAPGVVLTFPKEDQVRVVRVVALGVRRGPAPEAQALYEDLTPPAPPKTQPNEQRVGGRPTKKDRRDMETLKGTR
ncbi:RNA-binding S4 domain-containing protein [Thalassorhabdomicrobium marinisediminis]|uniref:RNA-binding S4 domain-containing protein n=1 Tax=Thalassorhabdomicrobium marinisediminis TaxID=2170577 RepID=UPI002491D057|nr:RNA-binding S4 domain-containing protein [Thalassorhabdomicrobium marinisediminis]